MGIPMRQKTILGSRGFSQLQEKLTTHGFQDSWGCLKIEFSTSKNMQTWEFCSPTELFQIATCFPRNLFLVSPGWAGLLFQYSRLQPVSSLVRTNLGFEMGGAQPIYWKIHASLSLPYVFGWFLRCGREKYHISMCLSTTSPWRHMTQGAWPPEGHIGCIRMHEQLRSWREGCCAGPVSCLGSVVGNSYLLRHASTISTCTAHQQCFLSGFAMTRYIQSQSTWFCLTFWFIVVCMLYFTPADPHCFHLLVHRNWIGLQLWRAMRCWESTRRWRREWRNAWFDWELQWTNGYLISSHNVSIFLCPQTFLLTFLYKDTVETPVFSIIKDGCCTNTP